MGILWVFPTFSQQLTVQTGFVSDLHAGTARYNEYGARFGIGLQTNTFKTSPLNFAFNFNIDISQSRKNTELQNIVFDVDDPTQNNIGFARAEFNKRSFSVPLDFGYNFPYNTFFTPYVSIGPRFEQYNTSTVYELYTNDSCYCANTTRLQFASLSSFGFVSGAGIRFMSNYFGVDLRVDYYGGWSTPGSKTRYLAEAETFRINAYGEREFDYAPTHYNDGFLISVNLIIPLRAPSGVTNFTNYDSSDYDYDNDSNDSDYWESSESSGGSGSSGSSGCESGGLSPSGRGGGIE